MNKLNKAFIYEIQGKTELKKCLCIPIDTMFEGKEKDLYMTFDCKEKQSEYSTHFVVQQLSKEEYSSLTDEQKKNIPILGNISESKFQNKPTNTTQPAEQKKVDEVPF